MTAEVSLAKCTSYNNKEVEAALRKAISAVTDLSYITEGTRVVIKPNLVSFLSPDRAATTHPVVLNALIRILNEKGAKITVGDSPGGLFNSVYVNRVYKATGMNNIEGAVLNRNFSQSVHHSDSALRAREFAYTSYLDDADVIINLCKLKTHCMTVLSGAVKNLFGCIPGLMKPELHMRYPEKEDFCRMLLDLSAALPPVISFVDAVEAMEGDGPTGGRKKYVGLTLCSADRYALDLVNAAVLGIDPASIPTVRQSIARGLCPASLAQVQLLGDRDALTQAGPFLPPRSKQTDFSSQFPAPLRPAVKKVTRWLQPRPSIRRKDCIGCGKCAESCPAHTIQILERKAVIAYPNCIRCFCCHEMCPKQAVDIRRLGIFDL